MTTPEYIYQQLRQAGCTREAACAVLGNIQAESAFKPGNLQDSFNGRLGLTDEEFVRRVDAGDTSIFMTPDLGFGLAQWTFGPRKTNFLAYMRNNGYSIASEKGQVEFMIKEFKEDFASIWKMLCTSTDLIACTDKLLKVWENPAVKDYTNRRNNANSWYAKVDSLEANVGKTGNSYNSTTGGGTKVSKVEQYTSAAEATAADNSHGYSQADRGGNPDYDCSSFVILHVRRAGIPVSGASYTANMRNAFLNSGFQNVTSSCNLATGAGMKRGDILLDDTSPLSNQHVAIYTGNGKLVHARTDEGNPQSGDQSGNEIRVQNYWNHPWSVVLRLPESSGAFTSSGSASGSSQVSSGTSNTPVSTNLRKGARGERVRQLQQNLIDLGYDLGKWGADTIFGDDTRNAVIAFQKKAFPNEPGEWDGIVGPKTQAAIEKALAEKAKPAEESKPVEAVPAAEAKKDFKVGEYVNFKGGPYYSSNISTTAAYGTPGRAKIISVRKGSKHPYRLQKIANRGSNVNGWVDENMIETA